ncbi:MAG: hypothetical protein ACR2OZ_09680 [Verrucomicrobiales bacterium]
MRDSLEETLARLRPAEPSPALMARLLAARRPNLPKKAFLLSRPAMLAAAAILALSGAYFIFPRPVLPPAAPAVDVPHHPDAPLMEVFSPVESRNYLVDTEETVLIELPGQPPLRLVRCHWLDEVTCRSDDRSAVLQLLQAREQWVPVATHLY